MEIKRGQEIDQYFFISKICCDYWGRSSIQACEPTLYPTPVAISKRKCNVYDICRLNVSTPPCGAVFEGGSATTKYISAAL